MAGIGIYLKQAREQLGYSLEEMNRFTNIHTEYLQALEKDRFDRLPSPFYARAFLRTYAKTLGLEAQPLLDMYEQMTQGAQQVTGRQVRSVPETQEFGQAPAYESEDHYVEEPTQPSMHATFDPATGRQRTVRQSDELQSSQRMSSVSANSQKIQKSFPNLPKPDLSAHTLSPRRVALEAKQGMANDEMDKKKRKSSAILPVAIAVGALVLVGVGVYASTDAFNSPSKPVANAPKSLESSGGGDANASQNTPPMLEEGETSDNELEGQQFFITNVDKLQVTLRGAKGESKVWYGPTPNPSDEKEAFTLRLGETKELDTGGKNFIWLRLGTPSSVEVSVNGAILNTVAQDVQKSYRIQVKK